MVTHLAGLTCRIVIRMKISATLQRRKARVSPLAPTQPTLSSHGLESTLGRVGNSSNSKPAPDS